MYKLVFTNRFRKDVKLLQKRDYDMGLLKHAFRILKKKENYLNQINRTNYLENIQVSGKPILNLIG